MEGMIAEIRMFAGTFAPRNWALCWGQTLGIVQYTALFAVIGTTYGGDGRSTFKLPDLRGRVPVGAGQGPGLTSVQQGQTGSQNQSGSDGLAQLGMNYIICLDGMFPSRD